MHSINISQTLLATAVLINLCIIVGPTAATAEQHDVDTLPRWALAGSFGTPRLYLKTLLADRPRGSEQTVRSVASTIGVGDDVNYGQPKLSFGLSPVLVYDTNINSGLPFDTIALGPFNFTVNEETRSREAWTVGVRSTAGMRIAISQGLVLNTYAQVGRRHAPEYGTNITDRSIGLCLRYTADSWYYLDGCISNSDVENDRSKASSQSQSLSFGRLFESDLATHEFSLSVIRQENQSRDQDRLRISSRNAIKNFGAVDASLTFGERVEGSLKPTFEADIGYGVILMGRPTRVSVGYTEETGGNIFGLERSETTRSIRTSRSITRDIMAYVSYSTTDSSIPEFSGKNWGFGLEYTGLRW